MSKRPTIYKSDSANTRHAKKSFSRALKSKRKKKAFFKQSQKNINYKEKKVRREKKATQEKKARKRKRQYISSPVTYSSEIQHFCDCNEIENWNKYQREIEIDESFSLFHHPTKVLSTLLTMLYQAKTKKNFITFKHKGSISFGALYLIDTICWQIASSKKVWRLKHSDLKEKEENILRNLRSIITNTSDSKYAYIINNKIPINRSEDDLARQFHKQKSKEIRDLVVKGIREQQADFELSQVESMAIDSAISEHFDNILLHVPNAEYGYLCGYFDRVKMEVTILIYNFGHTIAYTLDKKNLPEHIQIAVDEIIKNHTKKALIWGSSFTKENALTLLAIQEGISSKLDADITRGHGLMDFIEHCMDLNPNSKVVIISGKTAIKVDSSHKICKANVLGRERRILAFNIKNDIFEKPDENNVVNLPINFPGVIIETTIPLNIKWNK